MLIDRGASAPNAGCDSCWGATLGGVSDPARAGLGITAEWVAAYLYGHRGGHGPLAPVPVMPGQQGIPGQFLAPWSRDFFTVVAR